MTRIEAFCRAVIGDRVDSAFAREYLERGGHYQTFHGDPAKQDRLLRELPVRFVVHQQIARESEAA